MDTRLLLIAIAVLAAFNIATIYGPDPIISPTLAQNMTGGNATMMGGGNMTAGSNATGGNWTK
jgi:hypothetical protein